MQPITSTTASLMLRPKAAASTPSSSHLPKRVAESETTSAVPQQDRTESRSPASETAIASALPQEAPAPGLTRPNKSPRRLLPPTLQSFYARALNEREIDNSTAFLAKQSCVVQTDALKFLISAYQRSFDFQTNTKLQQMIKGKSTKYVDVKRIYDQYCTQWYADVQNYYTSAFNPLPTIVQASQHHLAALDHIPRPQDERRKRPQEPEVPVINIPHTISRRSTKKLPKQTRFDNSASARPPKPAKQPGRDLPPPYEDPIWQPSRDTLRAIRRKMEKVAPALPQTPNISPRDDVPDIEDLYKTITASMPRETNPAVYEALTYFQEQLDRVTKQGDDLATNALTFLKNVVDYLKNHGIFVTAGLLLLDAAILALLWWVITFETSSFVGFVTRFSVATVLGGVAGMSLFATGLASVNMIATIVDDLAQDKEGSYTPPSAYVNREYGPDIQDYSNHDLNKLQLSQECYWINAQPQVTSREYARLMTAFSIYMKDVPNDSDMIASTFQTVLYRIRSHIESDSADDYLTFALSLGLRLESEFPEQLPSPNARFITKDDWEWFNYKFRVIGKGKLPEKIKATSQAESSHDDRPVKQGFTDETAKIKAKVVRSLEEGMQTLGKNTLSLVDDIAALTVRDVTTSFHGFATTVRDAKSLFDIFGPIVSTVAEFVYEKATGKPYISPKEAIYHKQLTPLFEKIQKLEDTPDMTRLLYSSTSFRHQVESVIKEYEALRISFFKVVPDRLNTLFLSRLPTITDWKLKCEEAVMTAKTRPRPVCVEFFGEAGTGKTTLCELVAEQFHNILRKEDENLPEYQTSMVFDRHAELEFWDGFKDHKYVRYDDFLQSLEISVRMREALEIIKICNNAPYHLNFSGVSDKAKHYLRCDAVYITRNGDDSPSRINLVEPSAYYRRRDLLLEISNDPEYEGLSPYHPDYTKYWVVKLHDGFGKFIANIAAQDIAPLMKGFYDRYQRHANEKPHVPNPTLAPESVQLLVNQVATSTQKSLRTNGAPEVYGVTSKQGNAQFKSEHQDITDDAIADLEQLIEDYQAHKRDRSFWESLSRRFHIPELQNKLAETQQAVFNSSTEVRSTFTSFIIRSKTKLLNALATAKTHTVESYTKFINKLRQLPTAFATAVIDIPALIKRLCVDTIQRVTQLIKDNKWKAIFGSIGVVAAVAAITGVVLHFTKPEQQSRAEDKREEAQRKKQEEKELKEEIRRENAIERELQRIESAPKWQGGEPPKKQYLSTDIPYIDLFRKNLYHITICSGDGSCAMTGQVLFIAGRIAVTAEHVASVMKKYPSGQSILVRDEAGTHTLRVMNSEVSIALFDTEGCAVKFPLTVPKHHSILPHLPKEEVVESNKEVDQILLVTRTSMGTFTTYPLGFAKLEFCDPYIADHPLQPQPMLYWCSSQGGTHGGDSGGIWMTQNTRLQARLVGGHSGGNSRKGYAFPFVYEKMLPYLEDEIPLSTPIELDRLEATPPYIGEGYVPEATIKQGGSLPRNNPITPSVIAPELYELGYKTTTLPSVVHKIVPFQLDQNWKSKGVIYDGEYTSNNAVSPLDVIKTKLSFDPPLFPSAVLSDVFSNWHMEWPRPVHAKYHIYHPEDIIYGVPALSVDPIRMDASPGYPFTVIPEMSSRKRIFPARGETLALFLDRLKRIVQENEKGGQYMPIYALSIKVERRPVAKVFEANSRSIFGGPVDFQVYGQCFYQDLMKAALADATSRLTIGIDPHSPMWGQLHRRLSKHPNAIETDARRWDNTQESRVPIFIVKDAVEAYLKTLDIIDRSAGWFDPKKLCQHFRAAGMGCFQAYVLILNMLYLTPSQIKSGNFITTLFNCLINDLRWAIVYMVAAREHGVLTRDILRHKRANVEDAYHGDDALMTVSDEVLPWFNANSACYYWKKLFHIELTPAGGKKNEKFKDSILLAQGSFLKRAFRAVRDLPGGDIHVYAPLEWTVITDMVLWCTDPGQNPKITRNNVAAALMEAAHHPREKFDKLEADLKKASFAKNIPWVAHTYDEYQLMFRRITPPSNNFKEHAQQVLQKIMADDPSA